jgi:SAM-dependent methyltransferase/tetratricopeptide (TPR) repeat protein
MNRKERRALANRGRAAALRSSAKAAPAALLAELFGAAVAQHRAGALGEAERRYRHILMLFPNHAETHGMLGVALFTQGQIGEAVSHFERAAALKPGLPGPHDDLGKAYMAVGKPELAIDAAARALELDETEWRKAAFASCAKLVVFNANSGRFRRLMLRALVEAWARPRELSRACISLIKLDRAVNEGIARADSAWPQRLPAAELFGASGLSALSQNELLCRLLETDPITDVGLERLLTNVRSAMLEGACSAHSRRTGPPFAVSSKDEASFLAFYCAVARQCFINEYVFSITEAEAALAERLRASLDEALAAKEPCPTLWPAIVGAYFSLHALTNAQALLDRPWPQCVEALLIQQIKEPAEERRIASTIPVLTAIDDEVSRAVRQQYEENPYPRWVKAGPPGQSTVVDERQSEQTFDVLIAGCGTGLSTIEFARHARGARILAIDLSLASLSYAKRMAQSFGLANIEFAQADIMKLASIGRAFDLIDASGVLHHLADPWEGWLVLLSLLRPGGAMEVGLYSQTARRNVVAARAMIAQRGYRPIPADIRRCREEIVAAEDGSLLNSLMRSDDFFTMTECRDLLFHPQEHRLTLPDIKAFLTANDLQFAGFVLPTPVLQRFALRFPEPAAMTDLDRWHAFETEAPDTFGGMYVFWVRKPAARPEQTTPRAS